MENDQIATESQRREDSMRRLALEHAATANGLVTHHADDIVAAAEKFYAFLTGKTDATPEAAPHVQD